MQTLADLPSTAAAMAALAVAQPLLAVPLAAMPAEENDEKSSSICTDGQTVYVNPDFMAAHADRERTYMLAFMGLMVADDFIARKGGRDATAWSMACNMSIHHQLADLGVAGRPAQVAMLHATETKGLTADEIYERLMDGRTLICGKRLEQMLEDMEGRPLPVG